MAAALAATGSARFRVRGQSMWPFVLDGAEVRVAPLAGGASLERGALVALGTPDGDVRVHRVVTVRPLRTRGDALEHEDPTHGSLLGVVTAVALREGLWLALDGAGGHVLGRAALTLAPALRAARRAGRRVRDHLLYWLTAA